MDSHAKEKEVLLEIIKDFPENQLLEIIDFAQFLKYKNDSSKDSCLSSFKDKILNEDNNLLKRLAE